MSLHTHRLPGAAIALIYELLDAHEDTIRLASQPAGALAWEAHVDYLRAVQRAAREELAQLDRTDAA